MWHFIKSTLFAKTKMIFREKNCKFYLEGLTCDPLNYTMDHSKFIALIDEFISSFKNSTIHFIKQQTE